MTNMTTIDLLPREVLLQIFSLLGYRDLISVRRTCKLWHRLSQDDILLQNIGRKHLNTETWSEDDVCPSREEIGLAVFLGIVSLELIYFLIKTL